MNDRPRAAPIFRMRHGWIGLGLIALFWPLNWFLTGLRTAYLFFPLWLGYILVIDAWVAVRRGDSLFLRSRKNFCALFFASAPAWWLFEFINRRTGNWEYLGGENFKGVEYFLLSSISFSTVMPAVFETAEWMRTFSWMERFGAGPKLKPTPLLCWNLLMAGLVMLVLTWAWPQTCYPFVWGAVVLILEPINIWLGRHHFLEWLKDGDWRPVLSLALGAVFCGFFWEMWNFYSYPKWVYHTPGAEFLHLFEMPLLGYLGYLPFAWELFSIKNFLWPKGPRLKL